MSDPIFTPGLLPQGIVRPVWADPAYLLAISERVITTVAIPSLGAVPLAKNNPRRWAIGFGAFTQTGMVPAHVIRPTPDQTVAGWQLTAAGLWFNLMVNGPFVCDEWYLLSGGASTVTVYEVMTR